MIPRENQYKELYTTNLLSFETGDIVTIKRVRDRTDLLIYLSSKAILIDEQIEIINRDDTNKVIIVKKGDQVTVLSYDNAAHIYAEK